MALREEWARTGAWLFRWRSYLPLVALLFVLLHMQATRHTARFRDHEVAWTLLCVGISSLGFLVRIWTVAHAPGGTSGRNTRNQQADRLNTTGPYSVVRHPLYVGNSLMCLGIVLFARDWRLVLILGLAFWLYYERIMFAEEEYLREKFGRTFLDWAARTPAFIPDLRAWRPPDQPFDWKRVLRREYSGFFAAVASFTLLEAVHEYASRGRLGIDVPWRIAFALGLVVYLVLRTLKRRTKLLA